MSVGCGRLAEAKGHETDSSVLDLLISQSAQSRNVRTANMEWSTKLMITDVRPASANLLVSVTLSANITDVSLSVIFTMSVSLSVISEAKVSLVCKIHTRTLIAIHTLIRT